MYRKMEKIKLFAHRLRQLREEKDWSQEELAAKLGCSKALVSFYENAKREPGFTVILALSEIFNEDTAYLTGEVNAKRLKKIAE